METIKTIVSLGVKSDVSVKDWVFDVNQTHWPELQKWAETSLRIPEEEMGGPCLARTKRLSELVALLERVEDAGRSQTPGRVGTSL